MSSLNQVSLIGNVGRKPALRTTQAGTAVAQFSVATNDEWVDKDGAPQRRTEWHRVVAWSRLAEVVGEHLDQGRQVHVQGALRTREWTDGAGTKRVVTEIHASRVLFLGNRAPAEAVSETIACSDDEIPF